MNIKAAPNDCKKAAQGAEDRSVLRSPGIAFSGVAKLAGLNANSDDIVVVNGPVFLGYLSFTKPYSGQRLDTRLLANLKIGEPALPVPESDAQHLTLRR